MQTHRVIELSIISSSEIRRKVTRMLSLLASFSFAVPGLKPVVVLVRAKGKVASKAISVVEIAKSELEKDGAKWYQYSTVVGCTVLIPRKEDEVKGGRTIRQWEKQQEEERRGQLGEEDASTTALQDGDEEEGDDDDDDDDQMFEPMNADEQAEVGGVDMMAGSNGTHKIRSIPRLVIFLTRVPSPRLKELYG